MGYEGHSSVWRTGPGASRTLKASMALLAGPTAHVGGEVMSAGGTGSLRSQHLGDGDPGRVVRTDGHRLRQARAPLPVRAYRALDGYLGEPPGFVVADCGLKALGHGSRQPVSARVRSRLVLFGRAPHPCPGAAAANRGPDTGPPRPRRPHGGLPPTRLRGRRRGRHRPVGDRPARLVVRTPGRAGPALHPPRAVDGPRVPLRPEGTGPP